MRMHKIVGINVVVDAAGFGEWIIGHTADVSDFKSGLRNRPAQFGGFDELTIVVCASGQDIHDVLSAENQERI